MEKFNLPHQHEEIDIAIFHRELRESNNFYVVAELFRQLSDPTRLKIFWLLCHFEECVVNIAALLNISSPAVSYHLRWLQEEGIVTSRREGKEVYYKVIQRGECELLHKAVEEMMEISCPNSRLMEERNSIENTVERVHEYLVEHLSERITIEDLSKKFLINPTTLKRVFKEIYGTSLATHIKLHRMEYSAKLLEETNMTISQIADAVGYISQSKFAMAFKDVYHKLPSIYREEMNKKNYDDTYY